MSQHVFGDVVDSQPKGGSCFVLAVGDRDANFSLQVDVGPDGRGQSDGTCGRLHLQQTILIAVGEVVNQLGSRVAVTCGHVSDRFRKVRVDPANMKNKEDDPVKSRLVIRLKFCKTE